MVEWLSILIQLLAQLPLVLITILVLILYFERRFIGWEQRLSGLEQRSVGLEQRLSGLEQRLVGLEQRLVGLEQRLSGLEQRLSGLEQRLSGLERSISGLLNFNETFLSIQFAKGLLVEGEYLALKGMLYSLKPLASSKYYTKEVEKKLERILAKDPDEITWEDVFELERICDLLIMESVESNRPELASYSGKLRVLAGMAMGILLKKRILPPPRESRSSPS